MGNSCGDSEKENEFGQGGRPTFFDAKEGEISIFPALEGKVLETYNKLDHNPANYPKNEVLKTPVKFKATSEVYHGEWSKGKPQGLGKLYKVGGIYYEGTFKAGKLNGHGRKINNDGSYYQGNFKDGLASGKGKFTSDNYHYQGDFLNGEFHGQGILRGKDNSTYTGEFLNGRKLKGSLIWQKHQYNGQFDEKNNFHNNGVLRDPIGTYTGSFIRDQRFGKAKYEFTETKNRFDGNYADNFKTGFGTLYDKNNNIIYQGYWQNDLPNGIGTLFQNGKPKFRTLWENGHAQRDPQIQIVLK